MKMFFRARWFSFRQTAPRPDMPRRAKSQILMSTWIPPFPLSTPSLIPSLPLFSERGPTRDSGPSPLPTSGSPLEHSGAACTSKSLGRRAPYLWGSGLLRGFPMITLTSRPWLEVSFTWIDVTFGLTGDLGLLTHVSHPRHSLSLPPFFLLLHSPPPPPQMDCSMTAARPATMVRRS